MENSYIKIYRALESWEWYKDSKMVHLFIHLLLNANFVDGRFQGQEVKRGQLITGRKSLSSNTGITEQSIRTCLEKLSLTNEITIKSTNNYSLITIVKYEIYQSYDLKTTNKTTSKLTISQPTTNQQLTTIEEGNNKEIILSQFNEFRKSYPGIVLGNETEFENLKKKHKDYAEIIPKLKSIIDKQILSKEQKKQKGIFVPEWKNLKTWINNRCWEEEIDLEAERPKLNTPSYDATDLFGTK